jgi:hypothetical protein
LRLLVALGPVALTQATETVSPGRNLARVLVRLAGEPTAAPLTAVMTEPAVRPAVAAGLPQIVPSTRVPELTGAMVDGTARVMLLV